MHEQYITSFFQPTPHGRGGHNNTPRHMRAYTQASIHGPGESGPQHHVKHRAIKPSRVSIHGPRESGPQRAVHRLRLHSSCFNPRPTGEWAATPADRAKCRVLQVSIHGPRESGPQPIGHPMHTTSSYTTVALRTRGIFPGKFPGTDTS